MSVKPACFRYVYTTAWIVCKSITNLVGDWIIVKRTSPISTVGAFKRQGGDRGQSEAVAVLLLIGVAVVVVALIAVFVFDLVPTSDTPTASLQFEQSGDGNEIVTIYHGGGDELPDNVVIELTGNLALENSETAHDELEGLRPGQEAVIELSAGDAGDRISIVYDGSVIASYDLPRAVDD